MKPHKLKKAVFYFLGAIIGLIFLAVVLMNFSFAHQFLTRKVNTILSNAHIPVTINSIETILPNSVDVSGVFLSGPEGDTIIYAGRVSASFSTLALLYQKVSLTAVYIEDPVINFSTNPKTGNLNISEAFSRKNGNDLSKPKEKKSSWDVSLGRAELVRAGFLMSDSVAGLYIQQNISKITLETDRMSIIDKSIIVRSLEIDGMAGSIFINPDQKKKKSESSFSWNIGLADLNLHDIKQIFDNPAEKMKIDLILGEAIIRITKTDIKSKIIDFDKVYISRTSATLHMDSKSEKTQNKKPDKTEAFPWDIAGRKIDFDNVSCSVVKYGEPDAYFPLSGYSITGMDLNLSGLHYNRDIVNGSIENMKFDMENGFSVRTCKVKLASQSGTTSIDLSVETGESRLNLKGFADKRFSDIIKDPVHFKNANIDFNKSSASLEDIAFFNADLKKIPVFTSLASDPLAIDGKIIIGDSVFTIKELLVSQPGNIGITLQGKVINVFSPEKAMGEIKFSITDINHYWLKEILQDKIAEKNIPDFVTLSVEGALSDSLRTPDFLIKIKSDLGNIDMSGSLDFNNDIFKFTSLFQRVNLNRILNNNELGSFSGSADVKGKGLKQKSFTAEAVLLADSIRFHDYDYTRSRIECDVSPGKYDLRLMINDPSLDISMIGSAHSSDSVLSASLNGKFHANPYNLHFYKDSLFAGGIVSVDFKKQNDKIKTDIILSDMKFITSDENVMIKQINASLITDSLSTSLSGKSDFFNSEIHIEKPVADLGLFIGDYLAYIKSLIDPHHADSLKQISSLPSMNGRVNINYNDAFRIFIPDTSLIFRNIFCSVNTNIANSTINYSVKLAGVRYKKVEIENLNVSLIDSASYIDLLINADTCKIASQDVNNIHLTSHFDDWQSLTNLSVIDKKGTLIYDFEISSANDSNYIFLTVPSKQLILNGSKWLMDSPDLLTVNRITKALSPSFKMHTDNSLIKLIKIEKPPLQTYKLELNNVSLASIYRTEILPGKPTGTISGSADLIINENRGKKIDADIEFTNVSWSDLNYNIITLDGSYSSENSEEYALDINTRLDSSEIRIKGEKQPNGKRNIDARFKLIPVNTVQPFVKKFLTDIRGYVSGDFNLSTKNNLETLSGDLFIKDINLKINSLNSSYRMPDDRISFSDKKMIFNNFKVLDSLGHQLFIDGRIDFSNKNSVLADIEISSSNLQVMNRKKEKNSSFYGTIFVDTKLSVKGPVASPVLSGKVTLTGGTDIYFRQQDNLSLSESEKVLTFVSSKSSSGQSDLKAESVKSLYNKTSIESLVEIDPATRLSIDLSKKMFNIGLVIKGGGVLNYNMLINNQVNLSGKYEVSEGSADLKMIGWPNKAFRITKGGFIRWDGKLDDPELKFEAVNKVTSSYVNPVDNKERYVNFDVTLKLSNRLSAMDVLFTINTTDQYLMSIINTLSPEEQMRQAITILLFENIDLPGISTTSNYVSEQVNQLVASQLNALTKTTIKGIDISFGIDSYVQANASGGQETKTSLSYEVKRKLMNDRAQIELSGRINDGSSKQTSSEMSLNNVSFEYRLDSSATKFLKVYNEHTYEDVFEGEVIKTGVGITYRKNYPALGDIWRKDEEKKRRRDKETNKPKNP